MRLTSSIVRHCWLLGMCLAAFVFMEWVAITQFLSGHWYLADVGEINTILRNTLRGRLMYSPNMEGSNFGYHFSPALLLFSPLTLLSRYPIPLVTSYVAALALCPIPIFKIARQNGLPASIGLAAGFLFLANHFIGSIELANHYEVYYILLMLCTIALSAEGGVRFWVCAVAALGIKEDAAVWMFAYAVFMALDTREPEMRKRALKLAVVSVGFLLVAGATIWAVGSHQAGNATFFAQRLAGFGVSVDGGTTLLLLFASAGLLSLAGGRAALLVLVPAPMLLGGYEFTRNLLYYYSYPFMPFLIFSAIRGLANIRRRVLARGYDEKKFARNAVAFCLIVGAVQLPLPTRTDFYTRFPFEVKDRDYFRLSIAREKIPPDSPVAIQFGLWGVTPMRAGALRLSKQNIASDAYVFIDSFSPYGMDESDYVDIVTTLAKETHKGERDMIFGQYEFFIFSPLKKEGTK